MGAILNLRSGAKSPSPSEYGDCDSGAGSDWDGDDFYDCEEPLAPFEGLSAVYVDFDSQFEVAGLVLPFTL